MWIVVRSYNGYEVAITECKSKEEAERTFEEWSDLFGGAKVYLAKVKKAK